MSKLPALFASAMSLVVLSACGSGGSSPAVNTPLPLVGTESSSTTPAPPATEIPVNTTGLERLLGTVGFTYNFDGDTTTFATLAQFTSSSFDVSDSGATQLIENSGDKAIACRVIPQVGDFNYTCSVARVSTGQLTSITMFLFGLDTATSGSGRF